MKESGEKKLRNQSKMLTQMFDWALFLSPKIALLGMELLLQPPDSRPISPPCQSLMSGRKLRASQV